ncbi:MAG: DUF4825 domain-containing protein, partial [Clostridiales bacterium]|nr:DUF4825 domain-containing protein [Clostridiales bacterium]
APKALSYALWVVVLFRLVCPVSLPSVVSILGGIGLIKAPVSASGTMEYIPGNLDMMAQPRVDTGIGSISDAVNRSLPVVNPVNSMSPIYAFLMAAALVWCAGMVILLIYSLVSDIGIKRRISTATRLFGNVYETDRINSPFVYGIIRPGIFVPANLGEKELAFILKHERIHIIRRDNIIKPFAWLVLVVHWFNPLVWLAFALLTADMEMSCDERVIREAGASEKAEYSSSLLALSVRGRIFAGGPLAFGESSTKARVKNVISYRRPATWVLVIVAAACLVIAAACATNPAAPDPSNSSAVSSDASISTTSSSTSTDTANLNQPDGDPRIYSEELAGELFGNKTPYLGDNSKVGALTYLLPLPVGVSLSPLGALSLQTETKPYGMVIHYALEDDTKDYGKSTFIKNSALLFATIDNLDRVTHLGHMTNPALSSVSFEFAVTRESIEDLVGKDLSEYGKSREKLQELITILDGLSEEKLETVKLEG